MWTELHWVDGPWPGKLVVSARPRGEDWLEDEIKTWREAGVNTVLSLLEPAEERDLGLKNEAREVQKQGLKFLSLPIPDRQVPKSEPQLTAMLEKLDGDLSSGKNVLVHCRQGVGRTGLVTACLLVTRGLSSGAAIMNVRAARGTSIPETNEQREWIDRYSTMFSGAKKVL